MSFTIEPARKLDEDIAFILEANKTIEGEDASLTRERLINDIFSDDPKAFVCLFKEQGKPVGLIFYSFCYWASKGNILWVSQFYIIQKSRGKHLFHIKKWILETAKEQGAAMICWGTSAAKARSNRLWAALGAMNINENFSFWTKRV